VQNRTHQRHAIDVVVRRNRLPLKNGREQKLPHQMQPAAEMEEKGKCLVL